MSDALARFDEMIRTGGGREKAFAAALRQAADEALELAAQAVEETEIVRRGTLTYEPWDDAQDTLSNAAKAVRALASPAVAPAADAERFFPGAAEAMGEPAAAPAAETIICGPTCPGHPEPVAPAEVCRAEVSSRFPDYSHFECTLPKGHAGPHKEGGFAEWTDVTTVVAPSLLPRVLAALESEQLAYEQDDDREHVLGDLAAELRRYIATHDDLLRECEGLIATCGELADTLGYAGTSRECHALLAKLQARTTARSEGET